jgi:hypothetical protein
MTKIPPFDPADLKPIAKLHAEGKFPPKMKLRHIKNLCYARQFPCVKIRNEWHSTEAAIRSWLWDHATPAFRQITS